MRWRFIRHPLYPGSVSFARSLSAPFQPHLPLGVEVKDYLQHQPRTSPNSPGATLWNPADHGVVPFPQGERPERFLVFFRPAEEFLRDLRDQSLLVHATQVCSAFPPPPPGSGPGLSSVAPLDYLDPQEQNLRRIHSSSVNGSGPSSSQPSSSSPSSSSSSSSLSPLSRSVSTPLKALSPESSPPDADEDEDPFAEGPVEPSSLYRNPELATEAWRFCYLVQGAESLLRKQANDQLRDAVLSGNQMQAVAVAETAADVYGMQDDMKQAEAQVFVQTNGRCIVRMVGCGPSVASSG